MVVVQSGIIECVEISREHVSYISWRGHQPALSFLLTAEDGPRLTWLVEARDNTGWNAIDMARIGGRDAVACWLEQLGRDQAGERNGASGEDASRVGGVALQRAGGEAAAVQRRGGGDREEEARRGGGERMGETNEWEQEGAERRDEGGPVFLAWKNVIRKMVARKIAFSRSGGGEVKGGSENPGGRFTPRGLNVPERIL